MPSARGGSPGGKASGDLMSSGCHPQLPPSDKTKEMKAKGEEMVVCVCVEVGEYS